MLARTVSRASRTSGQFSYFIRTASSEKGTAGGKEIGVIMICPMASLQKELNRRIPATYFSSFNPLGIITAVTNRHLPGGGTYTGEWKNNKPNGIGTIECNGGIYEGDFIEGIPHGDGKLVYGDGRSYDGLWQDGQPNGVGVGKDAKGDVFFSGMWLAGKPQH